MSNAGRSNGNTFRVIKKWDKTGRQYAVVDIDGALIPHQIPTNGEVFIFADFRGVGRGRIRDYPLVLQFDGRQRLE